MHLFLACRSVPRPVAVPRLSPVRIHQVPRLSPVARTAVSLSRRARTEFPRKTFKAVFWLKDPAARPLLTASPCQGAKGIGITGWPQSVYRPMGGRTSARMNTSSAREPVRGVKVAPALAARTEKRKALKRGIVICNLQLGAPELVLAVLASCVAFGTFQKQKADALGVQCAHRHERGDFEGALSLCSSALAIFVSLNEFSRIPWRWKPGFFWRDVAQTSDNIGVVHMNLGNNLAALRYHQTALTLREQNLGPDHMDVAATRDNLGLVHRQMNELDQALELHNRALEIRLQAVGPKDLATAASKTAIANIHYQREQHAEALALYTEVLDTQQQLLGKDHLDVAATLQNIGTVLKHSDLNGSWENLEASLGIIVGIYGHKHRSVADALNNMGGVRYAQENWDGALETYQQALDIALSVLGAEHPDVAATLTNLGGVYDKLGRASESQEKFSQAAEIWRLSGIEWKDEMRQYLPLNFEGG